MTQDEKKATEDLLAGFDRPGRSPRAPRVQSRFVDFTGSVAEADPRRGKETALITRARRAGWLPWLGIGLVLVATCSAVAWIALRVPVAPVAPVATRPQPEAPPLVTTTAPSVVPVVVAPPPSASVAPAPPPARSAAPRAPAAPAPDDPRVDFVRNL